VRFYILTIFPAIFDGPFGESILKRAAEKGLIKTVVHNIRDFATDKHHSTDDTPYGGGAGMVMKPDPIFAAAEHALAQARESGDSTDGSNVILMTPQGRRFNQKIAEDLSTRSHLVFVCGHYEGVDERVREHLVTDELSIGDYVLTGGELAAMVVVDAVARLVPGVLGAAESLDEESISSGLLEYPHYTRPFDFRGWSVPEMLLSGNHAAIARWRREQALARTLRRRPDLLDVADLPKKDLAYLARLREEAATDCTD
jgi:tRNA (guanine37-N1)-methyltransferase